MWIKRLSQTVMIFVLGFYAMQVSAQNISQKPSPSEFATLPPACQKAMKDGSWGGHYCQGFLFMNRANSTLDKKARRYYLGVAKDEFHYVAGHSPPNSPEAKQAKRYQDMIEYMLNMK